LLICPAMYRIDRAFCVVLWLPTSRRVNGAGDGCKQKEGYYYGDL